MIITGFLKDVMVQVRQWFQQRALEVDTRSGQLRTAVAVLDLAKQGAPLKGDADMRKDATILSQLAACGKQLIPSFTAQLTRDYLFLYDH